MSSLQSWLDALACKLVNGGSTLVWKSNGSQATGVHQAMPAVEHTRFMQCLHSHPDIVTTCKARIGGTPVDVGELHDCILFGARQTGETYSSSYT